jgi:hypothetical protein
MQDAKQKGSDPLEASRFSNLFTRLAGAGQTPFGIGSKNDEQFSYFDVDDREPGNMRASLPGKGDCHFIRSPVFG